AVPGGQGVRVFLAEDPTSELEDGFVLGLGRAELAISRKDEGGSVRRGEGPGMFGAETVAAIAIHGVVLDLCLAAKPAKEQITDGEVDDVGHLVNQARFGARHG